MEINSKADFLAKLGQFYRVMDYPDRQLKLQMLSENMGNCEYYFYRMFKEITAHQYYSGFPEWAQSKNIIRGNEKIVNPALNDYGSSGDGEHVCGNCLGKKGHMFTEKIKGLDYSYFKECSTCGGKGSSTVSENNIFKKYIGKKAHEDFMIRLFESLQINKKETELKT